MYTRRPVHCKRIVLILFLLYPVLVNADSDNHVTIGAVLPLTGPAAHLGESNRRGALAALEKVNASRSSGEQEIRLIIEDSASQPQKGVSAFNKLVSQDKIAAAFVTLTSVAMSVRDIAERTQTVVLAESTHPDLTFGHEYVFRHFMSSRAAADTVAVFLERSAKSRLAIFHTEEEWGETAADKIEEILEDQAGSIVSREMFSKSNLDLRPQLLRIKASEPDALYLIGLGAPVVAAIKQMRELNMLVPVIGYVLCGQSTVMENSRGLLDGQYSVDVDFDLESEDYKTVEKWYQLHAPGDAVDQSAIGAYEGVRILADALRAGARTGPAIQKYLTEQSVPSGAMGEVLFSDEGDSVVPMHISKIESGHCKQLK